MRKSTSQTPELLTTSQALVSADWRRLNRTFGTMSYNPMDYSGAIGRSFRVGLKYSVL